MRQPSHATAFHGGSGQELACDTASVATQLGDWLASGMEADPTFELFIDIAPCIKI